MLLLLLPFAASLSWHYLHGPRDKLSDPLFGHYLTTGDVATPVYPAGTSWLSEGFIYVLDRGLSNFCFSQGFWRYHILQNQWSYLNYSYEDLPGPCVREKEYCGLPNSVLLETAAGRFMGFGTYSYPVCRPSNLLYTWDAARPNEVRYVGGQEGTVAPTYDGPNANPGSNDIAFQFYNYEYAAASDGSTAYYYNVVGMWGFNGTAWSYLYGNRTLLDGAIYDGPNRGPGRRINFLMWTDDWHVYVFGSAVYPSSDVYIYSINDLWGWRIAYGSDDDNKWQFLGGTKAPNQQQYSYDTPPLWPACRYYAIWSRCSYGNTMFLFAGATIEEPLDEFGNDLWNFTYSPLINNVTWSLLSGNRFTVDAIYDSHPQDPGSGFYTSLQCTEHGIAMYLSDPEFTGGILNEKAAYNQIWLYGERPIPPPPSNTTSCNSILPDSPLVCSGHGECITQDTCDCNEGYSGQFCEEWKCFGVPNDDPTVCSDHGRCSDLDTCDCDCGYSKEDCSYYCPVLSCTI